MNDLYLIIPMAGKGTRFKDCESLKHKPLIEIDGEPMFIKALNKIINNSINNFKVIIIIKKEDDLYNEVKKYAPDSNTIVLEKETQGALETLYLGLKNISHGRFLSLDCDLECFSKGMDEHIFNEVTNPALVTFYSQKPNYSYVRLDDSRVKEIKEKNVISTNAVAGLYYFNDIKKFKADCYEIFQQRKKTLGEYYISTMFEEIINQDREISAYKSTFYKSYGTPEEVNEHNR